MSTDPIQTADLTAWHGDEVHAGFWQLLDNVLALLGAPGSRAPADLVEEVLVEIAPAEASERVTTNAHPSPPAGKPAARRWTRYLALAGIIVAAGYAVYELQDYLQPNSAPVPASESTDGTANRLTPAPTMSAEEVIAWLKVHSPEASHKPGEAFRDCDVCPEMVVAPAGKFTMGSPASEEGRDSDEGPQHRVTIPRSFAVGKHEVTFAEWDACVAGGGCNGYRPEDRGWGRGRRPVIKVSWEDAKAYVKWLSQETGKSYRLLTEAEWEYAARAGTTTRYWWGNEVGTNNANCDGCGSRWDSEQTAPVGSFQPNGFGLYDTLGNVWEWVEDCWHDGYAGAPSDGGAWTDGGDCSRRVVRGGSWIYFPRLLRSAIRVRYRSGDRNGDLEFRVARTLWVLNLYFFTPLGIAKGAVSTLGSRERAFS